MVHKITVLFLFCSYFATSIFNNFEEQKDSFQRTKIIKAETCVCLHHIPEKNGLPAALRRPSTEAYTNLFYYLYQQHVVQKNIHKHTMHTTKPNILLKFIYLKFNCK